MRAVTLALFFAALLAVAFIGSAKAQVSTSIDMSSAKEFEEEFLYGILQRENPELAAEVAKLGDVWCSACNALIGTFIKSAAEAVSKGCPSICKNIKQPTASAICQWFVENSNICQRVINWATKGDTPTNVCKKIGFCNRECQCGICTPAIAGAKGRCLAAIRSCNHPYTKLTLSDMFALTSEEARDFKTTSAEDPESLGFCLRGRCDGPDNYGCCLTCL